VIHNGCASEDNPEAGYSVRFISFHHQGRESYGAVEGTFVVDLGHAGGGRFPDLRSRLLDLPPEQSPAVLESYPRIALGDIHFRPVIPNPSKIICVGLNYREHVGETGRKPSEHPVLFLRLPDSQIGHLQPLVRPRVSTQLDFEGELAVIIGRPGRHIRRSEALNHVAGYSIYNEASVRDWQKHTHQYTAGKNFSGTGAFGPSLVTAEEITDPRKLALTTRLNGAIMQQASVAELIFPIEDLIAYISRITELVPGDVLVTGTPSGVGGLRTPPVWMKPGDVVEVEISQLGVLHNPVIEEKSE
jgi:2-keto-4-pentenoate hydratase/2-oxohepta-3-ene-1,7-dioic acid hydratase in catechol pathway